MSADTQRDMHRNDNICRSICCRENLEGSFPQCYSREGEVQRWTSKYIVYQHINWRQTVVKNRNRDIDFKTIGNICRDFFVTSQDEDQIILGHILKVSINANKIVVETTFHKNLT